jgi:pSer/pThr/pTyr-binding forkhead associated (FHA) protein
MIKVSVVYPTPEGSQEVPLGSKLSFGRGKDVDLRFDDEGLSRVHATIYRDDERVWIIDENSTNGTFVNNQKVPPQGMALKNGDRIKAGESTELQILVYEDLDKSVRSSDSNQHQKQPQWLTIAFIAFSIFLFLFSVTFIIFSAISQAGKTDTLENKKDESKSLSRSEEISKETPKLSRSNSIKEDKSSEDKSSDEESLRSENENSNSGKLLQAKAKTYMQMSESEKDAYVKEKAEKISRIIGNQVGEPIPPEAIRSIRNQLQGYVNRIRSVKVDNCQQGSFTRSDTITILERARKNAPFIIRSFYAEGLDPQIGLYIAMIESEHCYCLQSPTGPLGMFQFARKTAETYGLKVKADASPSNPDERCDPEKAAIAAAKYLKYLIGRFGTGPMSFPLAIASYNSGQGGLSQNLEQALKKAADRERSFWTLVANQVVFEGKVGEQFRKENVKYVPKFFAAAIIGENPQDFGIQMAPLSTYTK